jgi:predicted Rossmann-fold nucleotide-binding protein
VVFAPGSAGTIQEIFQDAAQNHYASFGPPSPMVLLGREYWTERHPVWPVLDSLSDGRDYRDLITITDDEDEVVDVILRYRRDG